MAISTAINLSDPDGAVITISELDNAIRLAKTEVQERLDDSIIDTTIAGWINATSKQLKEGLARIHTSTVAAKPVSTTHGAAIAGLAADQVWVRTDAPVAGAGAFQYYDGAVWQRVPIATENLLDASVTAAKVATSARNAKIAVVLNAQSTSVELADGWKAVGTAPIVELTVAPTEATTLYMIIVTGMVDFASLLTMPSALRLRKTTAVAATLNKIVWSDTAAGGTTNILPFTLIGLLQGSSGAQTVQLQARSAAPAPGHIMTVRGDVLDPDGVPVEIQIEAIELRA